MHTIQLTSTDTVLARANVWEEMLDLLQKRLSRQIYENWFTQVQFDGRDDAEKTIKLSSGQFA